MFPFSFSALEAAAALGGEGLIPFYGLLEGGREGELFAELEDYFYYAQIRRSVCLKLFTDLSWKTFCLCNVLIYYAQKLSLFYPV